MISLDKKVIRQRLGNDMSLSNVDMHHKTNSEKEEFKAQTKPRSITQAELIDA